MPLDLWLIDAFTDRPFGGNPAGVCLLHEPVPDAWMQNLAMEMNQAETAFLLRIEDGFGLRWFTPASEVDLCGHATLASAHFLYQEGHLKPRATARFTTRSGLLTARQNDAGITLDFPATPPVPAEPLPGLLAALGLPNATVLANQVPQPDYLVVVDDPALVRGLAPDFAAIARLAVRGVIVSSPSDTDGIDFLSRFFAPAFGVPEDPVTGSAHCTLGPYWASTLGRTEVVGFQASRRGGTVRVSVNGDRVGLTGKAITVLRGVLAS